MSYADDECFYCDGPEDFDKSIQEWKKGFHIDGDGNNIKISEMTTKHLENTIKYFKDEYDTSILEQELNKRIN